VPCSEVALLYVIAGKAKEFSSLLTVTDAQDVPRLRIKFSRGQEEKNSKEMSTNGKNKENKGIILSTKVYV